MGDSHSACSSSFHSSLSDPLNESKETLAGPWTDVKVGEAPPSFDALKRSLSNSFSQSLPSHHTYHAGIHDGSSLNRTSSLNPMIKHGVKNHSAFDVGMGDENAHAKGLADKFQYRAEDDFGLEQWKLKRDRLRAYSLAPLKDPIAPGIYTRVTKATPVELEPDIEEAFSESTATRDVHDEKDAKSPDREEVISVKSRMTEKATERAATIVQEDSQMILPVIQEFILDSHFQIVVEGRKLNEIKILIYYLLCFLTLGLVYLFSIWFPWLRSLLTTTQSPLAYSTHVFVTNTYGQKDLIPVRRSYYGDILIDVFGKQRVHECIVVDELPAEDAMAEEKENFNSDIEASVFIEELQDVYNSVEEAAADEEEDEEDYMMYSYTCNPSDNPIQATHVDIQDTSSLSSSVIKKNDGEKPCSSDFLYYFDYRCIRFIYHPNTGRYFKNSQWESFQAIDYKKLNSGLSKSLHSQRKVIFSSNLIEIEKKSLFKIFVDEILHPFNIFQLLSVALWVWEEYYYYSGAIFVMSVFSMVVTMIETRRNIENLKKMTYYSSRINIQNDTKWTTVSSEDLVPGDIIEVRHDTGHSVPCDLLLLEGDCIVNESMLTGESIPVFKVPVTDEIWNKEGGDSHEFALTCDKCILYAGTKLIRVRSPPDRPARAVVIRTGFNTTKGNLVRNMLFPRPNNFRFYKEAMMFIGILSCLAFLSFCLTLTRFIYLGVSTVLIVMRGLDLITIVVPPALTTCMAIGTTFAMGRLKAKNIFCISPPRINVCGKLNMFCFDKTGTLTEEGLDLLGIHHVVEGDPNQSPGSGKSLSSMASSMDDIQVNQRDLDVQHLPEALLMILGMSTCHTIKSVDGKLIGDPLEVKMFEFCTNWELEDSSAITVVKPFVSTTRAPSSVSAALTLCTEKRNELAILKTFEFVPALRRMTTMIKIFKSPGITAFVKGAPESICEVCLNESLPANYYSVFDHYTTQGYRVIALACKSYPSLNWLKAQKLKREEVESSLTFLGFLIFENKLKSATKSVMKELQKGSFRTVIVTGDNILTAMSVAKDCKIINHDDIIFLPRLLETEAKAGEERESKVSSDQVDVEGELRIVWESIDQASLKLSPTLLSPLASSERHLPLQDQKYTIGCTGHILEYLIDHCSTDVLHRLLLRCHVFARMNPDQKQRLVECFQRLDYCVGFCGDGANDCGALKAADVGLSLSEAEASVAAPFTCKVPDIRCTLDLVKEGRSALATSFSCFKFMASYSIIEFTTVTILYYYASNMSDFQFLYIDMVIILPIAICIGRLESSHLITEKRPSSRLLSRKVLSSLLSQFTLQALFQYWIYYFTTSQSWFDMDKISNIDPYSENTRGQLNTCLFSFATFVYITLAFIFCWNTPYQPPVILNGKSSRIAVWMAVSFDFCVASFMTLACIALSCNLLFLFFPSDWLKRLLLLVDMPMEYRVYIFIFVFAYILLAGFLNFSTHKIVKAIFSCKKSNKKRKLYKKLEQEAVGTFRNV